MELKPAAVRITARASITRFDSGEGSITSIVEGYGHTAENNTLIYAQIIAFRPDIPMA